MKSSHKKDRRLWMGAGFLFASLTAGGILYAVWGHRLIQSAYEGQSFDFLNAVITGQATTPLQHYLRTADRLVERFYWLGMLGLGGIFFFVIWVRGITLRRAVLSALVCLGVFSGFFAANAVTLNDSMFERSATRLLERSEKLKEKFQDFDEREALARLGMNPINGFYYRLDERIEEARVASEKEAFGEGYESIGHELRKVLFMNSPLRLTYPVTLPDGQVLLSWGMEITEGGEPVTFKVSLKQGEIRQELFSRTLEDAERWEDATLDLSDWGGSPAEISIEVEGLKGNTGFWSNPILYSPPNQRKNFIVILEDALRANHLSSYGYFRETSPFKDQWVQQGVLFLNAFSQATYTTPSCASFMTSLYPTATGVWKAGDRLPAGYLTLAEILRSQGFLTASLIQNDNAGPFAGLHQGFSYLWDGSTTGKRAEEIYGERLKKWILGHQDRNFFLYLHLIDPHSIYDPPKPYDRWYHKAPPGETLILRDLGVSDPPWVEKPSLEGRRLLYDGEILYNDQSLKTFLAWLEDRGILENTLIVFISDHGEHLGEHGFLWGHRPPGYSDVIQVPLMMVDSNRLPSGRRIKQPVQLLDLMPTLLEFAQIEPSAFPLQGGSLVSLIQGEQMEFWDHRLVISEEVSDKHREDPNGWGSIFYRHWHFLNSSHFLGLSRFLTPFHWTGFPESSLGTRVFDLRKDPEENHYLNRFYPDLFLKLRVGRILRETQEQNLKISKALGGESRAKVIPDEAVRGRLAALGYLN